MAGNDATTTPRRWAEVSIFVLLWGGAPAAFFTFALNRFSWTTEYVALGLAIAIGAGAWLLGRSPLSPAARTIRTIVLIGAALIVAVIAWNLVYASHIANPANVTRGEFRRVRISRHWPVYGRYSFDSAWRSIPAIVAMGAMLWFVLRANRREQPVNLRFLWTLALLQLIATLAFGFSEDRIAAPIHYQNFRYGLENFDNGGVREMLGRYVGLQPQLGSFNSHYPRGFMLMVFLERRWNVVGLLEAITLILVPLTLFPISRIVKELGGEARAQRWALALFATSAGALIFPTLTPTVFLSLIAALIVRLFVMSMNADSLPRLCWLAALLGMYVALFAFLSFSVGMLLMFVTIVAIIYAVWSRRVLEIAVTGCIAATVAAALLYVIYLATGFDWVAGLRLGQVRLTASNDNYFDAPMRYALRVSGNLLAYLLSLGFVLAAVMIRPRADREMSSLARAFICSVPATLLLASLVGMGRLETERVWQFFTPLICVSAAFWFARGSPKIKRAMFAIALIAQCIWACASELLYHHY